MNAIPLEHGLALAAVLFSLGLIGLMVRRNILFMLMSLEVMMNACALVVSGVSVRVPSDTVYVLLPSASVEAFTVSALPLCSSTARVTLSALSTGQLSTCCKSRSVRTKAETKLSGTVYTGSSPSSLI